MKIMVLIGRAVAPAAKTLVKSKKTAVEPKNPRMSLNPFCKIALEEALRIKESGLASEVAVVGQCPKALRRCLAMGADQALFLDELPSTFTGYIAGYMLKYYAKEEETELLIFGKQCEADYKINGQMMAGIIKWPHRTFASKVVLDKKKQVATVDKEVDGGLKTLCLNLPAVITIEPEPAELCNTPQH